MFRDFMRILAAFTIVGTILTVAVASSVRAEPIIAVGVDGKKIEIKRKTVTLWELSVYFITDLDKGEYKKFQALVPSKSKCDEAKGSWLALASTDPSAQSVKITCRPIEFDVSPKA